MKEEILSRLKSVQRVMDTIDTLRAERDPWTNFVYYWDYLDFIVWIKNKHVKDYQVYDLETDFETLDEFGEVYIKVIEPTQSQYVYRNDEGILNIDTPLSKMIKRFYDYVINLQEDELSQLNMSINVNTPSLTEIMQEIMTLRSNLTEDTKMMAKEIVKEIIKPSNPVKTLTKKEKFEEDVEAKSRERYIKAVKKASKKPF